jgi:hypothetical protein
MFSGVNAALARALKLAPTLHAPGLCDCAIPRATLQSVFASPRNADRGLATDERASLVMLSAMP